MSTLCGFRPTGRLHLGHYFSVIKPGQSGCDVLIANYHAPEEKDINSSKELLEYYGIKNIRIQKDIFDGELYFRLLSLSKIGDLSRMTQYQSTDENDRTGQLLTYPVLMTHDVVGYDEVIVGEDQTQHLHYARKLIRKYNSEYGTDYPIPKPNIVVGRIKDLKDTSKKMSKSSPQGCLFLDDFPEAIEQKIKKATTDESGLANLHFLYKEFVKGDIPEGNEKMKNNLIESFVKLRESYSDHLMSEIVRTSQEMGLYKS